MNLWIEQVFQNEYIKRICIWKKKKRNNIEGRNGRNAWNEDEVNWETIQ